MYKNMNTEKIENSRKQNWQLISTLEKMCETSEQYKMLAELAYTLEKYTAFIEHI